MAEWTQKQVLITVRTYPTPSAKDIEVSCTAAITLNGEWIRLFPVRYRYLAKERRFRKYDLIDVRLRRTPDARPESFNPDPDSIKIVGHIGPGKNWINQKKIHPFALKQHLSAGSKISLSTDFMLQPWESLSQQRLLIGPADSDWTQDQLAKLRQHEQGQLFGVADAQQLEELEKIPYKFSYKFKCAESICNGHSLMCTDWEMGEAYRSWRHKYGTDKWEEKFRQRFEWEMINKFETYFYVGTVHQFPKSWIIVGLFYPPLP